MNFSRILKTIACTLILGLGFASIQALDATKVHIFVVNAGDKAQSFSLGPEGSIIKLDNLGPKSLSAWYHLSESGVWGMKYSDENAKFVQFRSENGQEIQYNFLAGKIYAVLLSDTYPPIVYHLSEPAEPAKAARILFINAGSKEIKNLQLANEYQKNALVKLNSLLPGQCSAFGTVSWPKGSFGIFWTYEDNTQVQELKGEDGKAQRGSFPEGTYWAFLSYDSAKGQTARLFSLLP